MCSELFSALAHDYRLNAWLLTQCPVLDGGGKVVVFFWTTRIYHRDQRSISWSTVILCSLYKFNNHWRKSNWTLLLFLRRNGWLTVSLKKLVYCYSFNFRSLTRGSGHCSCWELISCSEDPLEPLTQLEGPVPSSTAPITTGITGVVTLHITWCVCSTSVLLSYMKLELHNLQTCFVKERYSLTYAKCCWKPVKNHYLMG